MSRRDRWSSRSRRNPACPCGSARYSSDRISMQPGHRPVEFERLVARYRHVQVRRLRFGRGKQFDMRFVERVDQDDEALGLVATLEGQARDVLEDHRVELARRWPDSRTRPGLRAQVAETEPRHAAGRFGNLDRWPLTVSVIGSPWPAPERLRKARVSASCEALRRRRMEDRSAGELLETEIRPGVELARSPCALAARR